MEWSFWQRCVELKANPNLPRKRSCDRAELDKGKGSVATVLVQKILLHCRRCHAGRFCLQENGNDDGWQRKKRSKEAGPSTPVVLDYRMMCWCGESICRMQQWPKRSEETLQNIPFLGKNETVRRYKIKIFILDDLFIRFRREMSKNLVLLYGRYFWGSVEAVKQSLLKLCQNDRVVVKIIIVVHF